LGECLSLIGGGEMTIAEQQQTIEELALVFDNNDYETIQSGEANPILNLLKQKKLSHAALQELIIWTMESQSIKAETKSSVLQTISFHVADRLKILLGTAFSHEELMGLIENPDKVDLNTASRLNNILKNRELSLFEETLTQLLDLLNPKSDNQGDGYDDLSTVITDDRISTLYLLDNMKKLITTPQAESLER
jgi:hypothetical protein